MIWVVFIVKVLIELLLFGFTFVKLFIYVWIVIAFACFRGDLLAACFLFWFGGLVFGFWGLASI